MSARIEHTALYAAAERRLAGARRAAGGPNAHAPARGGVLTLVLAAVAALAVLFGRPHQAIGPGSMPDVRRLVSEDGRVRSGALLVTTISVRRAGAAEVVLAWLDPGTRGKAVIGARAAALRRSQAAAVEAARRFVRDGQPTPSGIRFRPVAFGGASAGLAFALAAVEVLSNEDLAAGRRVAVTGTIAADGRVGPVTGLEHKVAGARRAGADVMVVPAAQLGEARGLASGLPVIGVRDLHDAVDALGGSAPRR